MQRLLNDHYGRMAPNPVVYVANADSNTARSYTKTTCPNVHIDMPQGESLATWHKWLPEKGVLVVENATEALLAVEDGQPVVYRFLHSEPSQDVYLIDTDLAALFEQEPALKDRISVITVVALPYTDPCADCQVLMSIDKGDLVSRAHILLLLTLDFLRERPSEFNDYLSKKGFAAYKSHEVDILALGSLNKTFKHYLPLPDAYASEFLYMAELLNKEAAYPRLYQYIIYQVLYAAADGSRRPGGWERGLLERMGLVADCPEHQVYRAEFGRPSPNLKHSV
ncbi:hypothetical protein ACFQ3H_02315, partial [Paralysiella testudinis]